MSAYSIATRGLAGRKIPQGVLAAINTLLFGASEPGAWYDPSDLSTLFQDTAGTTPVTAVEQAVALMLDKSGRGNHASQATSTKRPKYSRRVNLLTETEFRGGIANLSVASNATASALDGYLGAIAVGARPATAYKSMYSSANVSHVISAVVEMDDGLPPSFSGASPSDSANDFVFVLMNNIVTPVSVYEVIPLGGSRYRVSATLTPTTAANGNTGILKYAGNSARTFKFTALDVRLAADAHLPYQWVNTATDYDADPAKFPGYLRFDGVDDALSTSSIDFTGTDKMTVWAGITKLSDAATAVVTEFGNFATPLDGAFLLAAPASAAPNIGFTSRGTLNAGANVAGYPAPLSTVATGVGSISTDESVFRLNGVQVAASPSDQGTGNYGNYPLYIGARAGTSLFLNGRIYQLIVRGAQSSLSQIEAVENLIRKTMRLP